MIGPFKRTRDAQTDTLRPALAEAAVAARLAIEALDFTAENERVVELEAERANIETACRRAQSRQIEIRDTLTSATVHDGDAVAKALLSGSAALPHAGRDALVEEASALNAGVRELDKRMRNISNEIDSIRSAARKRAFEAITPLSESLIREAEAGAEAIMQAFASLKAIGIALQGDVIGARRVGNAISNLHGPDSLVPYRSKIAVDPSVVAAIEPFADKGPGLHAWDIVDEVSLQVHRHMM